MSARRPKPRRVALFSPNGSALYISVLHGLRAALEEQDVAAFVVLGYYKADQMAQFCDLYEPDIVVEIDRFRGECAGLPDHVKHIAWIQDWRAVQSPQNAQYAPDRPMDSDLILFSNDPRLIGFEPTQSSKLAYFLNATTPKVFWPEDVAPLSDLSLVGYIPHLDGLEAERQPIAIDLGQVVENAGRILVGSIREAVDRLEEAGITWNTFHVLNAHRVLNEYLAEKVREDAKTLARTNPDFSDPLAIAEKIEAYPSCLVHGPDLYQLENIVMRIRARRLVVDEALKATKSLRFYGIGEWKTYPEYTPYYQGCAMTDSDVRRIFRSSAINLHNAMGQMHPRTLDCMASGSVIFVNAIHTSDPDAPETLHGFFQEGEHFVEYEPDTLADQIREWLPDTGRRERMGRAARERVLEGHTWRHRVDQFLDLAAGA